MTDLVKTSKAYMNRRQMLNKNYNTVFFRTPSKERFLTFSLSHVRACHLYRLDSTTLIWYIFHSEP